MGKKSKKSNTKNIERLKIAQELLKRKQPPVIDAPDLLEVVSSKNRALQSAETQSGSRYPIKGIPSIKAINSASKKSVNANKGLFVEVNTKFGKYKTRVT